MNYQDIQQIFQAQTTNVRELNKAWNHTNRTINQAYKDGDHTLAQLQTKMMGLIFCAYTESMFSKIIHTPYGLSPDDIKQICFMDGHVKKGRRDVVQSWHKSVELATKKISTSKSNYIPNLSKRIGRFIDNYIKGPSQIRNKIAHGQWHTALNSNNTAVNEQLTQKVSTLTIVDLYRNREAFDSLAWILEDIIESPNKAHWKDFWDHMSKYEEKQKEMKSWTLEGKIKRLKEKKEFYKIYNQ